jgi:hypothetical protein
MGFQLIGAMDIDRCFFSILCQSSFCTERKCSVSNRFIDIPCSSLPLLNSTYVRTRINQLLMPLLYKVLQYYYLIGSTEAREKGRSCTST